MQQCMNVVRRSGLECSKHHHASIKAAWPGWKTGLACKT